MIVTIVIEADIDEESIPMVEMSSEYSNPRQAVHALIESYVADFCHDYSVTLMGEK